MKIVIQNTKDNEYTIQTTETVKNIFTENVTLDKAPDAKTIHDAVVKALNAKPTTKKETA